MISLTPLNLAHATELAAILGSDQRLREALSRGNGPLDGETFLRGSEEWTSRRSGTVYAIVRNGQAIGTVSTSTSELPEGVVRIGYWIASTHWGRGLGAETFRLTIKNAKNSGFHTAVGSIPKMSFASAKIWQRLEARLQDRGDSYAAELDLTKVAF